MFELSLQGINMGLPDYEMKETYSAEEMQHVVAREVAKHQITLLTGQVKQMESDISEINSNIKRIFDLIDKQSSDIEKCRKDLKDEIKNEYATRLELQELRADLRVFSTRIVTAITVIVTLIQFVFQYFG